MELGDCITPGYKATRSTRPAWHCSRCLTQSLRHAGEIFVLTSRGGIGGSWAVRNVAQDVWTYRGKFADGPRPAMPGYGVDTGPGG